MGPHAAVSSAFGGRRIPCTHAKHNNNHPRMQSPPQMSAMGVGSLPDELLLSSWLLLVLWGSYPRPTTGAPPPVAPTCSRQNTAQPVEDSPARAFPKRRLGGGRKNQLLRRILKFSPLLQLQESYSQTASSCSNHTGQMTTGHPTHTKSHQSACHGMVLPNPSKGTS